MEVEVPRLGLGHVLGGGRDRKRNLIESHLALHSRQVQHVDLLRVWVSSLIIIANHLKQTDNGKILEIKSSKASQIIDIVISYFDDDHQTIVLLPIQDGRPKRSLAHRPDLLVVQQLLVLVLAHLDGIGGEDNDDDCANDDDDDDDDGHADDNDDDNLP